MKRFYCTVCKKVKRVRNIPANVAERYATDPALRVGTCDRHGESLMKSNKFHYRRAKVGA